MGWFRQYIPQYTRIIQPLQDRKTALLSGAPTKGKAQQSFAKNTILATPSQAKIDAYNTIRKHFNNLSFLMYCDPKRQLYFDINISISGFNIMLYHLRGNTEAQLDGRHLFAVYKPPKAISNRLKV